MSTRKSKIISIRVSNEEYRRLIEACRTHNIPSVSDLARHSMRQILQSQGNPAPSNHTPTVAQAALQQEIDLLHQRLADLAADLQRLTQRWNQHFPSSAPTGNPE
jgi:hypothetical protein